MEQPKIRHRYSSDELLELFLNSASEAKRAKDRPYATKNVVLLRMDLIGDCTMFTGALRAIREHYRDRELTVLCMPKTAPIFERLGVCDVVLPIDINPVAPDMNQLKQVIEHLRQKDYDILLQPHVSRWPLVDVLAAGIRCNTRIAIQAFGLSDPRGGNATEDWVKLASALYDRIIPCPPGHVSEFDYHAAFVRGLGVDDYRTRRPCLPFRAQSRIDGDYYVLYPAGSTPRKRWSSKNYARIADHIFERTGYTGVILGTEQERWISEKLKGHLDPSTPVVDLMGQTSLPDVIDIIGNAKLCVSNDTSGAHIACATNTRCVAAVGGWVYGRFLPYHIEDVLPEDHLPLVASAEMPCFFCSGKYNTVFDRNPKCLRHMLLNGRAECIENIPYEQVEALVDRLIADRG